MLYIDRKKGEVITFVLEDGSQIILKVENCETDFGANISIKAPKEIIIWRGEYNGEKLITGE